MFSHMVQRYHSQTASSQNMKDDTSSAIDVPGNRKKDPWSRKVLILVITEQEIQLSLQDRHRRDEKLKKTTEMLRV